MALTMEGFEELRSLKSAMPRASISKGGKISVNEAGVKAYGLSPFRFAKLFYNREKNRLGIIFFEKAPAENGLVVTHREKAGLWIAGRSTLAYGGVIPKETSRYPFRPYKDSDQKFIIDLDKGVPRKKKT